jgi:hypothetical protein
VAILVAIIIFIVYKYRKKDENPIVNDEPIEKNQEGEEEQKDDDSSANNGIIVDHSQQNHDEEHKDDGFCFGPFSTKRACTRNGINFQRQRGTDAALMTKFRIDQIYDLMVEKCKQKAGGFTITLRVAVTLFCIC